MLLKEVLLWPEHLLSSFIFTTEKALNLEIFIESNSSPIGAHCGIHKTLDAVNKRLYWPGMSVDKKKCVIP